MNNPITYVALTDVKLLFRRMRGYIAATNPGRLPAVLEIVRSMPCSRCGKAAPSDPHHVFGSYGSLKTCDSLTIPLCRSCHEHVELHLDDDDSHALVLFALVKTMRHIVLMQYDELENNRQADT